jgi:hypothetical protein
MFENQSIIDIGYALIPNIKREKNVTYILKILSINYW